jgi:hypothetical protein
MPADDLGDALGQTGQLAPDLGVQFGELDVIRQLRPGVPRLEATLLPVARPSITPSGRPAAIVSGTVLARRVTGLPLLVAAVRLVGASSVVGSVVGSAVGSTLTELRRAVEVLTDGVVLGWIVGLRLNGVVGAVVVARGPVVLAEVSIARFSAVVPGEAAPTRVVTVGGRAAGAETIIPVTSAPVVLAGGPVITPRATITIGTTGSALIVAAVAALVIAPRPAVAEGSACSALVVTPRPAIAEGPAASALISPTVTV